MQILSSFCIQRVVKKIGQERNETDFLPCRFFPRPIKKTHRDELFQGTSKGKLRKRRAGSITLRAMVEQKPRPKFSDNTKINPTAFFLIGLGGRVECCEPAPTGRSEQPERAHQRQGKKSVSFRSCPSRRYKACLRYSSSLFSLPFKLK
jgi:hypothetical protein